MIRDRKKKARKVNQARHGTPSDVMRPAPNSAKTGRTSQHRTEGELLMQLIDEHEAERAVTSTLLCARRR
jgi:hypothetical protein